MKKKNIIVSIILIALIAIIMLFTLTKTNKINLTNQAEQVATNDYPVTIGENTYYIDNLIENNIIPTMSAGMIPVKLDGESWVITSKDDTDWYNYKEGKPAYIMLSDGTYQSEIQANMTNKKLASENVGVSILDDPTNTMGSIYMWIPRFATNSEGEMLYIKQCCSVAETWKIPDIFIYKTPKNEISLAGIWVEYNTSTNTNEVTTKIKNMNKEDNTYGLIANALATNANDEATYADTINTFVGVGVPDDPLIGPITDASNPNRTILKILNSNKLEPIGATATLNVDELKINVEVTYCPNGVSKILNKDGKELSNNSNTAIDADLLGNGLYKYIIIDKAGNIKEINLKVEGLKIYIIPNLQRLKEFRDEVNSGNTFSGITVIQTADIDINPRKALDR